MPPQPYRHCYHVSHRGELANHQKFRSNLFKANYFRSQMKTGENDIFTRTSGLKMNFIAFQTVIYSQKVNNLRLKYSSG